MVEKFYQPGQSGEVTFGVAQLSGRDKLAAGGIETPDIDARKLLEAMAKISHARLISNHASVIPNETLERFEAVLARRLAGEPVHRIIGYREFFGRKFNLSKETLEPRPDTELLVEAVLGRFTDTGDAVRILDIGTGTGVIAVTLLAELQKAVATAVDISDDALETARKNANLHGVEGRLDCVQSDLFEKLTGKFDVIVSNPPYVESSEIERLQAEVRLHDPRAALDGGEDGLDFYRLILAGGAEFLSNGGELFLEIGEGQLESVSQIVGDTGWCVSDVLRDMLGVNRVICLQFKDVANLQRQ